MGIFDTPAIINTTLLKLKNKSFDKYLIDIRLENDENLFHIKHDYFESPCFFKITTWDTAISGTPILTTEFFPENSNSLKSVAELIHTANIEEIILSWEESISKMLSNESLYTNPELIDIKKELMLTLGLTNENAEKILDETQKKHAFQFCDHINDILDDLEENKYDENKITEIRFDIEKIKRDIENLKIKTTKDLITGVATTWSKIKLAKIGQYLIDKTTGAMASKLIGVAIDNA